MTVLMFAGLLAILLGLVLLVIGGVGHSSVTFNLREGSILGQAWLLVLILGFLLVLIDQYMVWKTVYLVF